MPPVIGPWACWPSSPQTYPPSPTESAPKANVPGSSPTKDAMVQSVAEKTLLRSLAIIRGTLKERGHPRLQCFEELEWFPKK